MTPSAPPATPTGVAGPVMVVGPGARFLSGVSYYTARLVSAFTTYGPGGVGLILHRLCPKFVYPGRERIGRHPEGTLDYGNAPVRRLLNWFWGPQIIPALAFVVSRRPRVLLLQFWTGTAAHTYLLLSLLARLRRCRVVVEFHEVLDVGEAAIGPVRRYVKAVMGMVLRLSDGYVVHSSGDVAAVGDFYPAARRLPAAVIPLGPFTGGHRRPDPIPGDGGVRYSFFGVLRDYKGLAELAGAWRIVVAEQPDATLTIAGEPWPEVSEALDELRALPQAELRLGHLPDGELADVLARTDVVVLPYRRSSGSGPLHTATALGLPVVTTRLASLVEAADGYTGAVFAEPGDPASLAAAMADAVALAGETHEEPNSWPVVVGRYRSFFSRIGAQ